MVVYNIQVHHTIVRQNAKYKQLDSFIYHDFIHIISYYLRYNTYKTLLCNQEISRMDHKSERIWLHFAWIRMSTLTDIGKATIHKLDSYGARKGKIYLPITYTRISWCIREWRHYSLGTFGPYENRLKFAADMMKDIVIRYAIFLFNVPGGPDDNMTALVHVIAISLTPQWDKVFVGIFYTHAIKQSWIFVI